MSIRLRSVRHADLDRLARLHARCFPLDAWDAVALAGLLAMPPASGHVAETDTGEAVGILFDLIVAGEAEILTLGVDPAYRRRGIARALLEGLYARALSVGANRVVLEVAAGNDGAMRLYENGGFRRVGQRPNYYQRPGGRTEDAWLLRRVLTE
jgi:ribosomal-protein-alanine N-acetyltransferase